MTPGEPSLDLSDNGDGTWDYKSPANPLGVEVTVRARSQEEALQVVIDSLRYLKLMCEDDRVLRMSLSLRPEAMTPGRHDEEGGASAIRQEA